MHTLRSTRRMARLVAGWVLLWFVVMTAAPLGAAPAMHEACADFAAHAEHAGHAAQACDADAAADIHAAHAERGAGGTGHCPVCLHAAAPPPPLAGERLPGIVPASVHAAAPAAPLRVRTAAPPPARGPPPFS